ncbi:MAG: zinc uptake transcriptional regulator Zur [Idiomarinaceae bacterium HL-53]|nr:MAG: zinc uptake transcriptional regulator Zur [Idiomarinaceae bacterium HL-53]CUS48534.1 zinc uptake regulator, Fur family [Idiomarinaceae bacterium HL-53]
MITKSTESLLTRAEAVCEHRGVRLTPTRKEVFAILSEQEGAIGAYDLLELLKSAVPNAKPPTIYRALDFLQEQGFVHKLSTSNSYVLCSHFEQQHPAQMLICKDCGSVQEVHSKNVDKEMLAQADKFGFDLHHQTIEAHGVCNQCQTKN